MKDIDDGPEPYGIRPAPGRKMPDEPSDYLHKCPKCGSEMEVAESCRSNQPDRIVCEMCGFVGEKVRSGKVEGE